MSLKTPPITTPKTGLFRADTGGEVVGQAPTSKGAAEAVPALKSEPPPLTQHTKADAPVSKAAGPTSSSLFDLRLGTAGIKRLWNKMQAMMGIGDPAALKRADEIVSQTRAAEAKLKGLPDGELVARLESCRERLAESTQGKREELSALRQQAASLEEKGDVDGAEALREKAGVMLKEVNIVEHRALDAFLPEVFGLTSEMASRKVGMRPYDVQLTAGALLHHGKVVEQYTGEGKTLSAVGPVVLGALTGRGVHVATSSNYLAQRDAAELAPVYNALGLSVAALLGDGTAVVFEPPKGEKRECARAEAYRADITYATATQFGFDHLRDNLVRDPAEKVQRTHATLIMDEVDSLLIDDARTPLIISGRPDDPHADVRVALAAAVEQLVPGKDIEFDRPEGWAALSDQGAEKLYKMLGLSSELDFQDPDLGRMVDAAVRARMLFTNGIDYIVKDGKVELIGQNGEILPGRRLSNGLHQAIEAREGVEINAETRTIGSITLREYLALYDRVAGMTGTAETAESLFNDVYRLDVVRVPTHKPLIRIDEPTRLFATIEEKAMAIMKDAAAAAASGRPVLIGVPDERSADALSLLFAENGTTHACLTAKNDAEEAKVIAEAGAPGRITIATPKGGRGVHFALGGKGADKATKQAVIDKGGLLMLGFSHNACERIDNQLRGRAGRQGEPGTTRFYASLEDRFFHGSELPSWTKERPPGKEGLVGREVDALVAKHSQLADSKMTATLKDSLPFDNVVGMHRQRYLKEREAVMSCDVGEGTRGIVEEAVADRVRAFADEKGLKKATLFELYVELAHVLPLPERKDAPPSWHGKDVDELIEHVQRALAPHVDAHMKKLGTEGERALRLVLLEALDDGYSLHLEELAALRDGIGWVQLAEKDPKVEFTLQADQAWKLFMDDTQHVVARAVCSGMPVVALE